MPPPKSPNFQIGDIVRVNQYFLDRCEKEIREGNNSFEDYMELKDVLFQITSLEQAFNRSDTTIPKLICAKGNVPAKTWHYFTNANFYSHNYELVPTKEVDIDMIMYRMGYRNGH